MDYRLILLVFAAIWGFYKFIVENALTPRIRLLHRAREILSQEHVANLYQIDYTYWMNVYREKTLEPTELFFSKRAEYSAYQAELRGLACAIGDKKLQEIVYRDYDYVKLPVLFHFPPICESEISVRSQEIHARIYELLEGATIAKLTVGKLWKKRKKNNAV